VLNFTFFTFLQFSNFQTLLDHRTNACSCFILGSGHILCKQNSCDTLSWYYSSSRIIVEVGVFSEHEKTDGIIYLDVKKQPEHFPRTIWSSVSEASLPALQHAVADWPGQVRLLRSAENLQQVHDPKVAEGRQGRNSRIQAAGSLAEVRTPGDPKDSNMFQPRIGSSSGSFQIWKIMARNWCCMTDRRVICTTWKPFSCKQAFLPTWII
jgi:hypothetical protein